MFTQTIMRQKQLNILRVYHQATADEIDYGLRWYAIAQEEAVELMPDSPSVAAGIIAALSPGLRWEFNILAADRIIAGEPLDGLGVRWSRNVMKAKRILAGEAPDTVLRGNKVRAFYDCIVNHESTSVCIDSHAYSIWYGKRFTTEEVPHLDRRNRYQNIVRDYHIVANEVGVRPMQLQAICWVVWRRLHESSIKMPKNHLPF